MSHRCITHKADDRWLLGKHGDGRELAGSGAGCERRREQLQPLQHWSWWSEYCRLQAAGRAGHRIRLQLMLPSEVIPHWVAAAVIVIDAFAWFLFVVHVGTRGILSVDLHVFVAFLLCTLNPARTLRKDASCTRSSESEARGQ